MIVNNLEIFKKYIPSAVYIQSFAMIEDALQIAEDWITNNILSESIRDEIAEENEAYSLSLLRRAVCTLAFYNIIPDIDLVLTESGFAVASGEQYSPASRHRVEKLLENTRKGSRLAIDQLVEYLLRKKDSWRGTEQFANLTAEFIPSISEYELHGGTLDADADWKSFMLKKPAMRNWIHEKLKPFISDKYLSELLEKIRDKEKLIEPEERQVLSYIQDAICMGVSGLQDSAQAKLANALSIMREQPDKFPTWAASKEAKGYTPDRSNSKIYML